MACLYLSTDIFAYNICVYIPHTVAVNTSISSFIQEAEVCGSLWVQGQPCYTASFGITRITQRAPVSKNSINKAKQTKTYNMGMTTWLKFNSFYRFISGLYWIWEWNQKSWCYISSFCLRFCSWLTHSEAFSELWLLGPLDGACVLSSLWVVKMYFFVVFQLRNRFL